MLRYRNQSATTLVLIALVSMALGALATYFLLNRQERKPPVGARLVAIPARHALVHISHPGWHARFRAFTGPGRKLSGQWAPPHGSVGGPVYRRLPSFHEGGDRLADLSCLS